MVLYLNNVHLHKVGSLQAAWLDEIGTGFTEIQNISYINFEIKSIFSKKGKLLRTFRNLKYLKYFKSKLATNNLNSIYTCILKRSHTISDKLEKYFLLFEFHAILMQSKSLLTPTIESAPTELYSATQISD